MQANNKESTLKLFMMDLVKSGKINYEGEANSEFRKRRVKLTQAKWKVVDDYYLYKSLAFAYAGISNMALHAVEKGIVKNPLINQTGDVEWHSLNNRIWKLWLITYPTYVSYEDFSKKRTEFLALESQIWEQEIWSKFLSAIKTLNHLEKSGAEEKCSDSISNEKAKLLQTTFMTISFNLAKISKLPSSKLIIKEFTADLIPLIDFQ